MQTDFTRLYSRLGLNADCSLHEFKQAYRRQFAELHPDRPAAQALTPEAQAQLREIIALYGNALTFHRRYGRLPGAPIPPPAKTPGAVGGAEPEAAAPTAQRPPLIAPTTPRVRDGLEQSARRRWLAIGLLIACLVLLLASWHASAPPAPPEFVPVNAPRVGTAPPPPSAAGSSDRTAVRGS